MNRARITSSGFRAESVWSEDPWVMGEGQEEVAGFRPLDEPGRHRDPWPFGTNSHEDNVTSLRDKSIDVRADSISRHIESSDIQEVILTSHVVSCIRTT